MTRARIVSIPDILGGKPHIEGTHVLAESVYEEIAAGNLNSKLLSERFRGLPPGAMVAVYKWAHSQAGEAYLARENKAGYGDRTGTGSRERNENLDE